MNQNISQKEATVSRDLNDSDRPLTDIELVKRAQQGDSEAFATLFRAHKARIYSICLRMTNNTAQAEDLTQDAFLQVFRKLSTFKGNSALSTWLYRIAVNTTNDWRREKLTDAIAHEELTAALRSEDEVRGADFTAVQEALLSLSDDLRQAIVLIYYENMTHAEAARVMGCAETTVSWRMFTARRKLKHLLTRTASTQSERADER